MPRNRKVKSPMQGGNIFGTIWNKVLKPIHNYVKDKKLISKGLNLIPHPYGKAGSVISEHLGYGRKRKRAQGGGAKRHRARGKVLNF